MRGRTAADFSFADECRVGALWEQFNDEEPLQIPQVTVFDGEEITEVANSEVRLTSHLFQSQSQVPFTVHVVSLEENRSFIHVKGKYVAPLVFVDKPGGWVDKESELRYLWDIFARKDPKWIL
jgi:hypothetical protein